MSVKQVSSLSEFINTLKTNYANDTEEWLSPSAVAKELQMHINTIYKIIQGGELNVYNLMVGNNGRMYYRIKRSDMENWLETRRLKYTIKKLT